MSPSPAPEEKARHDQEGYDLAWHRIPDLLHRVQPELGGPGVLLAGQHDRRHRPGLRHLLHEPRRIASRAWVLESRANRTTRVRVGALRTTTRTSGTTTRRSTTLTTRAGAIPTVRAIRMVRPTV